MRSSQCQREHTYSEDLHIRARQCAPSLRHICQLKRDGRDSANAGMQSLATTVVPSSSSSSQPTRSPPSPEQRRAQSGLEGGAGNSAGGSGLHSLRRAPSHGQPDHLSMTKYWHGGELNRVCPCVCRLVSICNDGGHSGLCKRVDL